MSKDTAKRGVWVLTRLHNDYDQHGDYFVAVWSSKPSLANLATYFGKEGGEYPSYDVMQAVAFLEHLRAGGGRQGHEEVWYELNFVEFQ